MLAALGAVSCSSTGDQLDWLTAEHQIIIAEDLAMALAAKHPPTQDEVFVADAPVRDRFESALREQGFAVSSDEEALRISGIAKRVPPNTWHIGLNLGDEVQLHRLYAIERDGVEAKSAMSYGVAPKIDPRRLSRWLPGNRRVDEEPKIESQASDWSLQRLPRRPSQSEDERRLEVASSKPAMGESRPETIAVEESDPIDADLLDGIVHAEPISTASRCGGSQLSDGSLRQSLERLLEACGVRVIEWPQSKERPGWVTDWLIDKPTAFTLGERTLSDLLDSLHASIGLRSRVNWKLGEARFSVDGA